MLQIRLVNDTRHGEKKKFVFKDLTNTKFVLIFHYGSKNNLQMLYNSPFPVISRKKTYIIEVRKQIHGNHQ